MKPKLRCGDCRFFVLGRPPKGEECWHCSNPDSEYYGAESGRNDPACDEVKR